jgi:hypothetical protein
MGIPQDAHFSCLLSIKCLSEEPGSASSDEATGKVEKRQIIPLLDISSLTTHLNISA